MAAVHFALSVLSVCVFLTFGFGNEIFSEEYKIEEDMHGRELVVASRGQIRKTIDLNDQSIVAVSINFNHLSQFFYSYIYSIIKKNVIYNYIFLTFVLKTFWHSLNILAFDVPIMLVIWIFNEWLANASILNEICKYYNTRLIFFCRKRCVKIIL